jgi:hypothetical protein
MRRPSFLTSSIRDRTEAPGMTSVTEPLIALARVSDDLIVGLTIGVVLGFLAGPLVRHLLAVREWAAASREAHLTDELLARMPLSPGADTDDPEDEDDRRASDLDDGAPVDVRWRTSR